MKITLGEVRRTVRDVLAEVSPMRSGGGRSAEYQHRTGSGFMLRDPDGNAYEGGRDEVRRALVRSTQLDAAERAAVMNTGNAPAAVIGRLKRDNVIKRHVTQADREAAVARARERDGRSSDAWERRDRAMRDKLERAYRKAADEFAKQWTDFTSENPDASPADAASDAADSFFWEYEGEWREWARALGTTRQTMKDVIADRVYDAMMKGAKKRGRTDEAYTGKLVPVAPGQHYSGKFGLRSAYREYEHGDQCPKCDGAIVSQHGQFEHLKCRDCGFVPPPGSKDV